MQSGGGVTLGKVGLRIFELVIWAAIVVAAFVMLTQLFGWNGTRLVATLQALTPYIILALVPIAGVALWLDNRPIGLAASLIGIGGLLLAAPVVFAPGQPEVDAGATGLRAASVNLLFSNPVVVELADQLADQQLDVIVFSEYTAEHQQVLLKHQLANRFPHRIDRDGLRAGGIAIWSRFPLVDGDRPETINYTLDVVVDGPDGNVRILGVHPPTPIFNFDGWINDLDLIGDVGLQQSAPTLIIGDFNASFWHPAFRDLLKRGFVDAHIARGQGFGTSWPTDEFFPPFIQLDHALTGNGLVATDVENFRLPGSDHEGFVVTVVPAR